LVKQQRKNLLRKVDIVLKASDDEIRRSQASSRMASNRASGQQMVSKGLHGKGPSLDPWHVTESTPPSAVTNQKSRRSAALKAASRVQNILDDADDFLFQEGRPVAKRRRRAELEPKARTDPKASQKRMDEYLDSAGQKPSRLSDPSSLPDKVQELLRRIARDAGDRRWACKKILQSGILAGQPVVYRKSPTSADMLHGIISSEGQILCFCDSCLGDFQASCLVFEQHAGSQMRKGMDLIFLPEAGVSLRDFCLRFASASHTAQQGLGAVNDDTPSRSARRFSAVGGGLDFPGTPSERIRAWQQTPRRDTPAPEVPLQKAGGPGRVKMRAPATPGTGPGTANRNFTKNRRLFLAGSGSELRNGDVVTYMGTGQQPIITGTIVIDPANVSGIRCHHCNTIISASQFEAHAGRGSRRTPYDNIFTSSGESLKEIAARMPDDVDYASMSQTYGSRRQQLSALRNRGGVPENELDDSAEILGGCCICNETDFTRDGFDDRTIIICDQCELEHHVGCLRKTGKCDLKAIPEGEWFCSEGCSLVHDVLSAQVSKGAVPLPSDDDRPLEWQMLHSKGVEMLTGDLEVVRSILQSSFDPIIDVRSNTDLLPIMVRSGSFREWDYNGMHCLLLRVAGEPAAAALVRVFGQRFAELPLIATSTEYRRQGLCRKLMDALIEVLNEAGVNRLCLPAASETRETWKSGFGFVPMQPMDVTWATTELRMLQFPGTVMMQREIMPGGISESLRPDGWTPPAMRTAAKAAISRQLPITGLAKGGIHADGGDNPMTSEDEQAEDSMGPSIAGVAAGGDSSS